MKLVVFLWFISLGGMVCAAEKITIKNWASHPSIAEIRHNYEEAHKLKLSTVSLVTNIYEDDCPTSATLYRDFNGSTRFYILGFYGGGGSGGHTEYFYDKKGRLLFAFTEFTFMGGKNENRVYFSLTGKPIWSVATIYEDEKKPLTMEDSLGYKSGSILDPEKHFRDISAKCAQPVGPAEATAGENRPLSPR